MVNLRRGSSRLGIALWLGWFLYWTAAYALRPESSENHPTSLPLLTYLVLAPAAVAAAALGIRWIVAGFRSGG